MINERIYEFNNKKLFKKKSRKLTTYTQVSVEALGVAAPFKFKNLAILLGVT